MSRLPRRTVWSELRSADLIDCALVASYVAIALSAVMVPLVPVVYRLFLR
jgi:hypothetical protein